MAAVDCTGCKETMFRALQCLDGVRCVVADHVTGAVAVLVDGDVSVDDLRATLGRLGYDASV